MNGRKANTVSGQKKVLIIIGREISRIAVQSARYDAMTNISFARWKEECEIILLNLIYLLSYTTSQITIQTVYGRKYRQQNEWVLENIFLFFNIHKLKHLNDKFKNSVYFDKIFCFKGGS